MSFDLEGNVSSESRDKVYAKLRELHWAPVPNITTVWTASFQGEVTPSSAIATARKDLAAAAAAGGVARYRVVTMSSDVKQESFSSV